MYYFIVNPTSRSGKGIKIWEKVEKLLLEQNIEYEVFLLDAPNKARGLAQYFSTNLTPTTVVIVGGDGTINEFLSGLTTYEGLTLGYIPTGSGNDFARGMHLPSKPVEALEVILAQEKFRNINIGVTSSGNSKKYFAISSGIGYDAAVCEQVNLTSSKHFLNKLGAGKLVYLFQGLRLLFAQKHSSMRVLLHDTQLLTFENVYFATAMNMKYEGGGFMFCPKASPVDQYLDFIVVEGLPKWKILLLLPTALFGKHTRFQGIHIYRCKRAVVQCEEDACVHADGEHFGYCKKVSFDLMKEKLRFIVD